VLLSIAYSPTAGFSSSPSAKQYETLHHLLLDLSPAYGEAFHAAVADKLMASMMERELDLTETSSNSSTG
jgi:hypothetical protein